MTTANAALRLAHDLDARREPDPGFTWDRFTIADQASHIQMLTIEDGAIDEHFIAFVRLVPVPAPDGFIADNHGMCWGRQLVAYRCDHKGSVDSWSTRFEVEAHTTELAFARLRCGVANQTIFVDQEPREELCD